MIDQTLKKLTKFSYTFKKTLGLAYFPPFWGQKYYFQKIWLCHAQHQMGP